MLIRLNARANYLISWCGRYYRTVKYLRWSQIRTRIVRKLLSELERIPALKGTFSRPFEGVIRPLTLRRLPLPDRHVLGDGQFSYIGRTFDCSSTWFPEGASLLWLFNLHYFDFLSELPSSKGKKRFVLNWIEKVPVLHRAAWHPFPSSLRICNWIAEFPSIDSELNEEEKKRLYTSIYNQLRHIVWQREEDLLGNHLIENCRALIVGGVFLSCERFVDLGLRILLRELPEQVLSDGGHYERSPQYHTAVLLALLDIYQALTQSRRPVPELLVEKCRGMTHFLAKILDHGELPQLNDTSPEFVPAPLRVVQLAAEILEIPQPQYSDLCEHLEDTGLFIVRTPRLALTFDVGPIGPDVQPGHAHSDTLSLLLSIDGVPVLVDSGVFTYEQGADRDYFRSAFAHNGPVLNEEDPNEMWGVFRVGRRSPAASCVRGVGGGVVGELVLPPGVIRRECRWDERSVSIRDSVRGTGVDGVSCRFVLGGSAGKGTHAAEDRSQEVFTLGNAELSLQIVQGGGEVFYEESAVSGRFGQRAVVGGILFRSAASACSWELRVEIRDP